MDAIPADLLVELTDRNGEPISLTTSDLAVAAVAGAACRMPDGCTLAVETIAERAHVCVRTVQTALRKLDKAGLVVCMERPRKGQRNDSNLIVIKSKQWLQHLRDKAALQRLRAERDRVQKAACKGEDKSSPELHSKKQPFVPAATAAWLGKMRSVAGASINPAAPKLLDPRPMVKLGLSGCTEKDMIAGIRAVKRRHEHRGRRATVWSWDYFVPAIQAAHDRRVTA